MDRATKRKGVMTGGENEIVYSQKYFDDHFEYRHVTLPRYLLARFHYREPFLLEEVEWRTLGVQQSRGWMNYAVHMSKPDVWILLFKRKVGFERMHVDQQNQLLAKNERVLNALNDKLEAHYQHKTHMQQETDVQF